MFPDKLIEYLKYALLGLIQGVAEILPVSSSSQLMVFQTVLNIKEPGLTFEMFLNIASFLALFIYFRKEILKLIISFFAFIFKKEKKDDNKENFNYTLKLLIAVIPLGILGLLLKDHLDSLKNLKYVAIGLFVTGSLLIITYLLRNSRKELDKLTFIDSLIIGASQTLSLLPGISRSGSTIIAGRANEVSLKKILAFSFLSYIIISVPVSVLGIYNALKLKESINYIGYSVAFIVTFIGTYLTAKLVLDKLKIKHLIYFGIYCLIIGGLALILYFI